MDPTDILCKASAIIAERGVTYGGIEDNFKTIAALAALRLRRPFHPYEIAVILSCVKDARAAETPDHADSHIDGINYDAFAAVFASEYAAWRTLPEVTCRSNDEQAVRDTRVAGKAATGDGR